MGVRLQYCTIYREWRLHVYIHQEQLLESCELSWERPHMEGLEIDTLYIGKILDLSKHSPNMKDR